MATIRLIDANALERRFTAIAVLQKGPKIRLVKAICEIHDAPTVDAVPVVHGRWEPHPDYPGFDRCSECKNCIVDDAWVDGEKWNYCPECGAKMDGGE